MFIAYSDASVKEQETSLGFFIVFEDKSDIRRRIVLDERDNNVAEAMALSELLAFLKYYNLKKGTIILDSNRVKAQLKKEWKDNNKVKKRGRRRNRRYLPKGVYKVLEKLQIRTQLINRKRNVAHKVCCRKEFILSTPISQVNRKYYQALETYKDYFMQQSVLDEYRKVHNNPSATFHEAQIDLNKEIWLADLVEDTEMTKVYEIRDKRIKVVQDTVVKVWKVNYEELVTIGE